jgi:hypothetical protein
MSDDRIPEEDDVTTGSYADLAALAKTLTDDDARLDEPPVDLWSRIEAQIRVTDVPAPPADLGAARARRAAVPMRFLAAAAALVLVATIGGIIVAVSGDDSGDTTVAGVALTNTDLDPRGAGSHGEATLIRNADGTYALDIDVEGLPSESGDFFELWVIDTDVEGMVSLGPLEGSGRFDLPASVDPAVFPVVDISIEPADGVPTHSGASVLRGVLEA